MDPSGEASIRPMADRLTIDTHRARLTYEADIDAFRGRIILGGDWIEFVGRSVAELRREARKSLRVYRESKAR